jgi:hypothetical protein
VVSTVSAPALANGSQVSNCATQAPSTSARWPSMAGCRRSRPTRLVPRCVSLCACRIGDRSHLRHAQYGTGYCDSQCPHDLKVRVFSRHLCVGTNASSRSSSAVRRTTSAGMARRPTRARARTAPAAPRWTSGRPTSTRRRTPPTRAPCVPSARMHGPSLTEPFASDRWARGLHGLAVQRWRSLRPGWLRLQLVAHGQPDLPWAGPHYRHDQEDHGRDAVPRRLER